MSWYSAPCDACLHPWWAHRSPAQTTGSNLACTGQGCDCTLDYFGHPLPARSLR